MTPPVSTGERLHSQGHFLGIDIGTSGVRGIVIDEHGEEVACAGTPLPPPVQNLHSIEQDPELWWQALSRTLDLLAQACDLKTIKAICVDGTSASVFLADAGGKPLHAALMYNDARATTEVEQIKHVAPPDSPTRSATSGLAKLLWLSKQDFAPQARYFCHQADWITARLRERYGISDENNALKSGYDPIHKTWPAWLGKLPFTLEGNFERVKSWLPEVQRPGTDLGIIDSTIAHQFGFADDTRILLGTTDSTASVMATGAGQAGDAITALGSTLVLKLISKEPLFAAEYGIYSQPYGDFWLCGGASNSGGAVLRQFFSDEQMAAMQPALQSRIQAGESSGLDYYPLNRPGERFPLNDPRMQPVLEPRSENDVLYFQGLLEGIACIEARGYELLHKLGAPRPQRIFSTGGGSVNTAWTQMRTNMLKVPISKASHHQAAYGVACLARNCLARNG